MAHVLLIAHMPLLRMEREDDFWLSPDCCLTRLPWDFYDDLTGRAFADWRARYDRTSPVFLWYQTEVDWEHLKAGASDSVIEQKAASSTWSDVLPPAGGAPLLVFHERLVDPVCAALALAAPAGVAAPPRSSVSFLVAAGANHLEMGGHRVRAIRVQGEADQELLFLPDGAGQPLTDEDLEATSGLVEVATQALADPDIAPALRQLMRTGDVTLDPHERTLLATAALEGLLLPDVTIGSGEVFTRRLGNMLGRDGDGRARVQSAAQGLYRRRSALLHADEARAARIELPPATAEQLLAGAVMITTAGVAQGSRLEALRQQLDEGATAVRPVDDLPLDRPSGLGQPHRLGPSRPWSSATLSSNGSLAPPSGTILSWSPLIGLHNKADDAAHEELGLVLTDLSPAQVVSMEDKDVRRDFIAATGVSDGHVGAIAVVAQHADGGPVTPAEIDFLVRRRDLGVAALRLQGFGAFVDPELLGYYVYEGHVRHRCQTVLRQSVIQQVAKGASEVLAPHHLEDLETTWSLLAAYERAARDTAVDRILSVFRRVHDRRFLPAQTRAVLAASCLESVLGAFRSPRSPVRLEVLVSALEGIGDPAAAWFATDGRAFRNHIAHASWEPAALPLDEGQPADHEPLLHLVAVLRAAIREMLETWMATDPATRDAHGAGALLVRSLRDRVLG